MKGLTRYNSVSAHFLCPDPQMRKTLLLRDSPSFRKYALKDILEYAGGLFDRTLILPEKGCAEYLETHGLGESCSIAEESIEDLVSSGGMMMYWDISVFPYKGDLRKILGDFLESKADLSVLSLWKEKSTCRHVSDTRIALIKDTPGARESFFALRNGRISKKGVRKCVSLVSIAPYLDKNGEMVMQSAFLFREEPPFLAPEWIRPSSDAVFYLTDGEDARKAFSMLRENESIRKWILQSFRFSDLRTLYGWQFVLETQGTAPAPQGARSRAAVICTVFYPDLIDQTVRILSNVPECCDIYIVCGSASVLPKVRKRLSPLPNRIEYLIKEQNRGRDVSSYLIVTRQVFMRYDYACLIHDKKTATLSDSERFSFFSHCVRSLLASKSYVMRILEAFDNNPELGILMPPCPPSWKIRKAEYDLDLGCREWMERLMNEFSLSAVLDTTPDAPYGDMLWVRTAACRKLFERDWAFEDFPPEPEPSKSGGTILHAIERLWPQFAADAGFTSAWVMPPETAQSVMNSAWYRESRITRLCMNTCRTASITDILGSGTSVSGILLLRARRILRILLRALRTAMAAAALPTGSGKAERRFRKKLSSLRNAVYRYTRKY